MVVHLKSIINSVLQYIDVRMKIQMSLPDIIVIIQYTFTYLDRLKTDYPRFNFMNYSNLTFEQADRDVFKNLDLAYRAMEMEGKTACALNASNEVTVQAFLDKKIGILDIASINEKTMMAIENILKPKYEDYVKVDGEAREIAWQLVGTV